MACITISSCTSDFLIVPLQGIGNIPVYNPAHVTFIYSHTKSSRSHHYFDLIGNPRSLVLDFNVVIYSRVVKTTSKTFIGE